MLLGGGLLRSPTPKTEARRSHQQMAGVAIRDTGDELFVVVAASPNDFSARQTNPAEPGSFRWPDNRRIECRWCQENTRNEHFDLNGEYSSDGDFPMDRE